MGRRADWRADAGGAVRRADWHVGSGVSTLGGILSSQPLGPRFHATSISCHLDWYYLVEKSTINTIVTLKYVILLCICQYFECFLCFFEYISKNSQNPPVSPFPSGPPGGPTEEVGSGEVGPPSKIAVGPHP